MQRIWIWHGRVCVWKKYEGHNSWRSQRPDPAERETVCVQRKIHHGSSSVLLLYFAIFRASPPHPYRAQFTFCPCHIKLDLNASIHRGHFELLFWSRWDESSSFISQCSESLTGSRGTPIQTSTQPWVTLGLSLSQPNKVHGVVMRGGENGSRREKPVCCLELWGEKLCHVKRLSGVIQFFYIFPLLSGNATAQIWQQMFSFLYRNQWNCSLVDFTQQPAIIFQVSLQWNSVDRLILDREFHSRGRFPIFLRKQFG